MTSSPDEPDAELVPSDPPGDAGEDHSADTLDDFDPADAPSNPDLVGHTHDEAAADG